MRQCIVALCVSFLVTTGVWFSISQGVVDTLVTLEVPVEYVNRNPGMEIFGASVNTVQLQLGGSGTLIKSLRPEHIQIRIDLGQAVEGNNTYAITQEAILLPAGVILKSVSPQSVDVNLGVLIRKELPIQIDWVGKLPNNLVLQNIQVDPEKVQVMGSRQILNDITTLYTEKVSLDHLTRTSSLTVNILLVPASLKLAPGYKDKVTITWMLMERNIP